VYLGPTVSIIFFERETKKKHRSHTHSNSHDQPSSTPNIVLLFWSSWNNNINTIMVGYVYCVESNYNYCWKQQSKYERSKKKIVVATTTTTHRNNYQSKKLRQRWTTSPLLFHLVFCWCLFHTKTAVASKTLLSCDGVYMAESSIPNAGWGVFAGRTFQAGDIVVRRWIGSFHLFVGLAGWLTVVFTLSAFLVSWLSA
jgi:hypothetical protein